MRTEQTLSESNRAQVVLWLAQAAQITLGSDRPKEADAIYERMLAVLADREVLEPVPPAADDDRYACAYCGGLVDTETGLSLELTRLPAPVEEEAP